MGRVPSRARISKREYRMHELSIAVNLVDIAETAAREAGAQSVNVVNLRLGEMSGVVKDALLFAYDIACQGTLLAGSRLEVETVPLAIYCPTCGREQILPSIQALQCPVCGTFSAEIRSGTEMEIISMEITDHAETD